jgi:hypothetical protein
VRCGKGRADGSMCDEEKRVVNVKRAELTRSGSSDAGLGRAGWSLS